MERRRFKRYRKRYKVDISDGTRTLLGFTTEVSERGMFVKSRKLLEIDTPVNIIIRLPDGSKAQAGGTIKRRLKDPTAAGSSGMGVEVFEYDNHYAHTLKEIIGNFSGEVLAPDYDASADEAKPEKAETKAAEITTETEPLPEAEKKFIVIQCFSCHAKNKVPEDKLDRKIKCGKCGVILGQDFASSEDESAQSTSHEPDAPQPEAPHADATQAEASNNNEDEILHDIDLSHYYIPCPSCGAKNKIPVERMGQHIKCGKCKSPIF